MQLRSKNGVKKILVLITIALLVYTAFIINSVYVFAMPFYGLNPKDITVRSDFSTDYSSSLAERKHNVELAIKKLNKTLVDVDKEFSFNKTVGERTEKNGFKNAKIIVNGEFVDGVGGGVCQVSTTLYNAVLLAGLKVTERHAHTLKVGYVSPSFDAMVNSGYADLKFVNNTKNPIIITAKADGDKISITIMGEKMKERVIRKSEILEEIDAPESEIVIDEKGEYPELMEGESKIIKYGSKGLKSRGSIIVIDDKGKKREIRLSTDRYKGIRGKVVVGKVRENKENEEN